MACGVGEAARHFLPRNAAHLACGFDDLRTNGELVGFFVDHPVGWGAAAAFGTDDLGEFRGYFVEFIGGAEGKVRSVGMTQRRPAQGTTAPVPHSPSWLNMARLG